MGGVGSGRPHKYDRSLIAAVAAVAPPGVLDSDIAKVFGCAVWTVRRARKEAGVVRRRDMKPDHCELPACYADRISPEPNTGCWLWTGSLTKGYGNATLGGKTRGAHRAIYEWIVGPIPDGLELDHLCRVTCCVNPEHLEPVSHAENIRRHVAAKRREAAKCA